MVAPDLYRRAAAIAEYTDTIVFLPELTLSRYPADALPTGRPDATAESLTDGPTVTFAREAAAASGVLVHASLFERSPAPDGTDDGLGFNVPATRARRVWHMECKAWRSGE